MLYNSKLLSFTKLHNVSFPDNFTKRNAQFSTVLNHISNGIATIISHKKYEFTKLKEDNRLGRKNLLYEEKKKNTTLI